MRPSVDGDFHAHTTDYLEGRHDALLRELLAACVRESVLEVDLEKWEAALAASYPMAVLERAERDGYTRTEVAELAMAKIRQRLPDHFPGGGA